MTADGTGAADTGGVFAGTAVDDCVDGDLERVCVRHDVDLLLMVSRALEGIFGRMGMGGNMWRRGEGRGKGKRGKTNDLKGVIDDPDGHQLLAVVAPVHH